MTADLTTTNWLLGIMAAVSVLEGVAVIGLLGGGFLLYRKLARLIADIEGRHVAPAAARVNGILDDVKAVTFVVRHAAEGVDAGARSSLEWLLKYFRRRDAA